MSIFKNSGVILKITNEKNHFLLDVFTYNYGKTKLKIKKKQNFKQKNFDIGYIINFEINVKKENSIHEIKNIKIKNEFDYINKNYNEIMEYLTILKIINEKIPFNLQIFEIYNIINEINIFKNITYEKLIFAKIKILYILGILKNEIFDEKIQKIFSFISKENIKNILKLKGLNEEDKVKLKNILEKNLGNV